MMIRICLLCLLLTAISRGQNEIPECEQSFQLYDKTPGRHALWFYKEMWQSDSHRCHRDSLYIMFLLPDRVHQFHSGRLQGNWIPDLYSNLKVEKYITLEPADGIFRINDSMRFHAPPPDSAFVKKYLALDKHDVRTWYWECNDKCVDQPIFEGVEPGLIYSHPGGLYKNYRIKQVRYYPESGFLIIVTEQPLVDENKRTMHGLLVYSMYGYED